MPETRDVSSGRLAWLALILAVVCGLIATAVWFSFPQGGRQAGGFGRMAGPPLQVRETDDLARLRAEEERALHSYGWVDRPAGVIHIPIERAMEVLAP